VDKKSPKRASVMRGIVDNIRIILHGQTEYIYIPDLSPQA